jgi:hypothetical protein
MKGIRSLFRLGALAMVAALLVVALTVPAAAADETCADENMLNEVRIISVTPLESAFTWEADDLLSYGDGDAGTYPVGQLEVQFADINTAFNITHYDVIATPSDDPGTSDALGIDEVTTAVERPSEVGSVVTATLDLEPGTNYDVDVVAFFYSVQISPNQSNQDSLGATTFLSPPFLGGGISGAFMNPESPSDQGVHYLEYKNDGQLHTLRWLNPETFGPFDHTWKVDNKEGADILCTNDDGDLEDDCKAADVEGVTHFRVEITDEDGDTAYEDEIAISDSAGDAYSAEFNLNNGTYTFAVDAGYMEDGKFYALSDKAQVVFDIPDDYRRYNQSQIEIEGLVADILDTVDGKKDDFDPFYDSDWDYTGLNKDKIVVPTTGTVGGTDDTVLTDGNAGDVGDENRTTYEAGVDADERRALLVFLNNLYN